MEKPRRIKVTYEGDSRRFHRFAIDPDQGIQGTIYIPKEQSVPDELLFVLKKDETSK